MTVHVQRSAVISDDYAVEGLPRAREAPPDGTAASPCPLDSYFDGIQERWRDVQAFFMEDPRGALERADTLLDEVTGSACSLLFGTLADLRDDWRDDKDTERLRTTLCAYRDHLQQILQLFDRAP
ncbi:hypothetical protein ACFXJ8_07680 [Nonomuraea sp. NPDC059194]|uniref:hypothetical protein n=1 Tax=Nonomuraea sp. NPDC059194 TaxID=3346764 RepID=UPI0036AE2353